VKLLKILLTSFVFYLGVLISPHFALALDNNDSQFQSCDITIEGTSVRPGNTPTLYASRTEGNNSLFSIRVCGNALTQRVADQESTPNFCMDNGDGAGPSGQELKVAIDSGPNNPFNDWTDFSLNSNGEGCYSGTISVPTNWNDGGLSMDVELDNDSDHICRKEMPVCRRVQAAFNTGVSSNDFDECSAMTQDVSSCSFLSMTTSGDEVYVNEPVTVSGLIDPLLNDAKCDTDGAPDPRLVISGPNGEIYSQRHAAGTNLNATFTPTRLGEHNLRFSLNTSTLPGNGTLPGSSLECDYNFWVCADGDEGCSSDMGTNSDSEPYSICESNLKPGSAAYGSCTTCYGDGGIWTAIGCIDQNPKTLVKKLINFGIGISGGIALIIILTSAFSLTISQGDVKKTSDAKEWLTAAIIGLLFIIFSVSILEFIGSSVLRIPGFGG
jgi:hypothetical protein